MAAKDEKHKEKDKSSFLVRMLSFLLRCAVYVALLAALGAWLWKTEPASWEYDYLGIANMTVFHPWRSHAAQYSSNLFEGWFYKLVTPDQRTFAIICGILNSNDSSKPNDATVFVMVIDGIACTNHYFQFSKESFDSYVSESGESLVRIGKNVFGETFLSLDLDAAQSIVPLNDPTLKVKGEVRFSNLVRWPVTFLSPGVMGYFSWLPFMECYHGIGSMNHDLQGTLEFSSSSSGSESKSHKKMSFKFDGGKGYSEKDWGVTFPSPYIWVQSNHFSSPNEQGPVSFFASVARIPAPFGIDYSFNGFLCGLYWNGTFHTFTTYNGAWLHKLNKGKDFFQLTFQNAEYELQITTTLGNTTVVHAPRNGVMEPYIEESLGTTKLFLMLIRRDGPRVLYQAEGSNVGLEVMGEVNERLGVIPANHRMDFLTGHDPAASGGPGRGISRGPRMMPKKP